jgi:O-acetyl-ADP-ribose deacetylase (regulator of RNase III)
MVDQNLAPSKRRREVDGLYYITHVQNLPSILQYGILSHQQVEDSSIDYKRIYNVDIVSNRRLKTTPENKNLWQYANLYFEPRNAMLYKVLHFNDDPRALENIAIVKVSRDILSALGVWMTNGNAASSETRITPVSKSALQEVVREIDREYWSREDGSLRKMMAELLVPNSVPPKWIEAIYVAKQEVKQRISQFLGTGAASGQPHVIVDPYRFFQPDAITRLNHHISLAKGDMFFSRLQTLTISVNTKGVMGKGLASRAKYQFPDVYVHYQDLCRSKMLQIGKPALIKRENSIGEELAQVAEDTGAQTWFLLFPTKAHWRDDSKIEYIRDGMQWLVDQYEALGIQSLALPALGCGLGNLKWAEVGPVLCSYADQMTIPVCIYLPNDELIDPQYQRPDFLFAP